MHFDTTLVSSVLDSLKTCTETKNSLLLVKKFLRMMGSSFIKKNTSLMMYWEGILKAYRPYAYIEFIWGHVNFVVPLLSIQDAFT